MVGHTARSGVCLKRPTAMETTAVGSDRAGRTERALGDDRVSNGDYALRFISGKYQGGEYPLPDEAEIVIGRGGELDIVLVEDMVSRKHAKITTQEGKIMIHDLGSTNGTFVNGEKIRRARLKEGDRVLIGTSILKLISTTGRAPEEAGKNIDDDEFKARPAEATMSGSLSEVALPDLLQLFSTSRKSGALQLDNNGDEGVIHLREGKIFYATYNDNEDLGPLKALYRMIGWSEGNFQLGPPTDEEFMLEIEEPTDQLIMEGVRQLDEYRAMGDDLPEHEDMIQVHKPLRPPLSSLAQDELEVLQLIYNNGFFLSVLDESPYSDLRTAQVVRKLLKEEYVRI